MLLSFSPIEMEASLRGPAEQPVSDAATAKAAKSDRPIVRRIKRLPLRKTKLSQQIIS
jgi:hypothetical protein